MIYELIKLQNLKGRMNNSDTERNQGSLCRNIDTESCLEKERDYIKRTSRQQYRLEVSSSTVNQEKSV